MSKKPSTIRIGRRYRANRLAPAYDMLVVGSGIGGLTTAACLAKMGKKVCVLEQHYTAGGFTHSYDRNGYEWDVGVHYIGDMGSPRTMGRRLFDYITDGALQWAPMDDHFDRIFLGEEHYDLVAGKAAYRAALIDAFPEEEHAIDTYLAYMREVKSAVRFLTLKKVLPDRVAGMVESFRSRRVPAYFNTTTREVLETLTSNQKLIAVLTGQWGDNGLPPAQSSFIIHSMIAQHYMHGGYYPVGGASRMAETIIPVIQQAGGEVFTYASVEEILVGDRGVRGVRMADGNEISAPIVVSGVGVFNTFETLLGESVPGRDRYIERLGHVQASMSSLCLYIGLRHTAEELGLPKTNLWIYPSENYEAEIAAFEQDPAAEFPLVYVSFPSAKDPSFTERYPGRATIEIVAPGPHAWFEPWADKPWGKRGDDYEALKERLSQRLLAKLYEKLPQLEGKVDYYELSTSLSTDYFCRYKHGEIYGLDHTPERFEQDWLKPKTEIPGLWLTGQDVLTCGVVGAMVGGLLTAIQLGGLKGTQLAKKMFF
ncbi:MAG: NAD(P)/FAD-dependent oxidoreductase [Xanthomonadales bacterium]|nr:NAD(P)/FAD-dependent oxidoreductase [Gammaproteobacteria bacterium]NND57017.1 NAD(P)/FAD-dependent oxidoreductase [Xanthomonadales bacterium]NNK51886.1 NAD(P)/FAD-dependent oxidoreductase [Xanthomonadales bacterium]